ncbi:oxidation resistance protein 1 isoform X6 [Episyrphus balteatus]|uniref:oxidation resistance protein 1 isoform X6 n=1 Tax=Episyrphus balteatus TaxID=286459 RepID=UPI002485A81D|nr:oxidation resistance protein 1 isoform X6 [Episyrphus balteatus]
MNILDNGKYRLKKDWNSCSIPSLVDIDEHDDMSATIPAPQKAPRRSSIAIGLLGKSDKTAKRRSSIAVTFLGRRDSHKITKDTNSFYESAVRTEKSDGSPKSPDIIFSSDENFHASSPKDTGRAVFFEDTSDSQNVSKSLSMYESPVDKERSRGRRSSLQTKLDRRRRKNFDPNQMSPESSSVYLEDDSEEQLAFEMEASRYMQRQKRHSWWNIFAPDQKKQRSRRASQDVTLMTRSADSLAVTARRSKSRSVDHGLAAPFDLDSLRSKVEGRFESVDRLTNERKKSSLPSIPTVTYTVGNRDTLTSVAARFDTTPSELTHLNRLNSSFVYPGQQLLVPDKNAKDDISIGSGTGDEKESSVSGKSSPVERKLSTEETNEEKDILDGLRPGSPKPGHIERISPKNGSDLSGDDPVITQRFLKINVRHITDGQGVVGGVLLVTPNAVMFDPNVSDTLVIEHGPESYGVIAPMELVINAAIFHDIAHMRVAGGEANTTEKAEIYYPKSVLEQQQPTSSSHLEEDDVSELGVGSIETCDDQESICSGSGRDGDAFPKAFDRERVTPVDKDDKDAEAKETSKTESKSEAESDDTEDKKNLSITDKRTTLEERRKSLLDHHWAIPSKDRSSDEEADNESNTTVDSARAQDPHSATSSLCGVVGGTGISTLAGGIAAIELEHLEELSKQTRYDSGIDIRDPIPNVQPIPKKSVYSDADIVLSSDWVPPKTISPTNVTETTTNASSLDMPSFGGRKKTSSVSFSVDENEPQQMHQGQQQAIDKSNEKKNKMLKRLSYPLTWVEGLTGETGGVSGMGGIGKSTDAESAPNTGDSNQSVFSKVFSSSPITLVSELGGNLFSKTPSEESGGSPVPPLTPHSTHSEGHVTPGRSSIGTFMRPHSSEGTQSTTKLNKEKPQVPKLDYRSMVSIDDKPELFVSVDKLIPRPARACPDPPLYLRLRMGKPIGKAIPLPTSVMSYGKNKLRPEYWFSVPKNRVDELYRFVNTWVPHLYGELDEEQIKARGFELIQHDTEWTKSGHIKNGRTGSEEGEEIGDLTRESWEVLSMSTDEYRKASLFTTGSFDLDFPIPDLIGTTEILTEEHREKLCTHLPARAEGYSWSLVFSTSQHGFSLNSLYRKMQRLESPVLIVIQDTDHNVFGALTSCSLHVSDHFYGTGESLLYKFNPSYKVFHWTGENLYFIKGNVDCLSIGAGDGRFGLWLDGDLNQGRSQSCSTYGNEPLSPQEDFVVKTLECWAFV